MMINCSHTQTENWNWGILNTERLQLRLHERKYTERMRKADNWNDKSRWNAGICIHYGLLMVSKRAWSTRRGSFICSLSNFLLLRLGVWISDVSAPLVSPRGHCPVTQFERHLTGNEIRPGERAWRADRKSELKIRPFVCCSFIRWRYTLTAWGFFSQKRL